ncbi:MAG: hypothetical protein M3552_11340 [Planctomycetota bacterium]|nr:hypothetical protein [Planctomycetota bacterium]
MVQPRGIGSGNDSHKEYSLEWRGVTIGISGRAHRDRKLHNFLLQITGDGCLTVGVADAWEAAISIVNQLGGDLIDAWIRRMDVCVDLPGIAMRDELVPAVLEGRFVTTAKKWKVHYDNGAVTGFEFGKAPRLRIVCYDKKQEIETRSPVYRQALLQNRWGGGLIRAKRHASSGRQAVNGWTNMESTHRRRRLQNCPPLWRK